MRWTGGKTLSYCIVRSTFESDDHYQRAVTYVHSAIKAWQSICNVKFEYRSQYDAENRATLFPINSDDEHLVTFVVLETAQIEPYAVSFFPSNAPSARQLRIYPYLFEQTEFDRVAVLAHEIGHVLGWRHEHARPDAPFWEDARCRTEAASSTRPFNPAGRLTEFDPDSIMGYPWCRTADNVAIRAMRISDADVRGAQMVYGAPNEPTPNGDFLEVDPTPFGSN